MLSKPKLSIVRRVLDCGRCFACVCMSGKCNFRPEEIRYRVRRYRNQDRQHQCPLAVPPLPTVVIGKPKRPLQEDQRRGGGINGRKYQFIMFISYDAATTARRRAVDHVTQSWWR